MHFAGTMRKAAVAAFGAVAVCATAFGAPGDRPAVTDTLNDFNPEYPVGIYIQEIASNQISTAVNLTNGVLTVGGESINIAEPSHTVVETNVVDGSLVVSTNTYTTVYEDGLDRKLDEYATKEKVSIVDNGDGTFTTNRTEVAYLSDIPPDEKKADKTIETWDFYEPSLKATLVRAADTNAPFASWTGTTSGDAPTSTVELFFKDGAWNARNGGGEFSTVAGALSDATVSVGGMTFIATNRTMAMVVYTDQFETMVDGKLDRYVAKTNLTPIAAEITEERLQTIGGITDTLRGIKNVINGIGGIPSMRLTVKAPETVFTLKLAAAEMAMPGDSVEIDWGDGSEKETTTIPASHTYTGMKDGEPFTVVVKGFIRKISGSQSDKGPVPFLYAEKENSSRNPTVLVSIKIDDSMPLEELGDYTFLMNGLDGDLSFLPPSVSRFGKYCFFDSHISSLVGMPTAVEEIPEGCFENTSRLTKIEGISPNVTRIGDSAFRESVVSSIAGIPSKLESLGDGCFMLSKVESLSPLGATSVSVIPKQCFLNTGLQSIDGLPQTVTEIREAAFLGASITSADLSQSSVTTISGFPFGSCYRLSWIRLPSTATNLSSDAFAYVRGNDDEYGLTVIFEGLDVDAITNIANFAFGIANAGKAPGYSRFDGTDGVLASDGSGGWTVGMTRTDFSLLAMGGSTVELGNIVPAQTARGLRASAPRDAADTGYAVDWGDGTVDSLSAHSYAEGIGDVTIKLLGKVDSISGDAERPFISIDGSPTNDRLVAVSVGGAVGLKELGRGAFRNCTALKANRMSGFGNEIEKLGEECFAGMTALTISPVQNTSVTELPKGCFKGSSVVGYAYARALYMKSLGDECFMGCTNLIIALGFTDKLERIGDRAFSGCANLRDVDFLSKTSVSEISDGCFQNCASLTNLPPLDGIDRIGRDAFAGCTRLAGFSVPRGTTIGDRAFYGCGTADSVEEKTDEDGFRYKLHFDCGDMKYVEVASMFGLNDGDVTDTRTGIAPEVTKFVCEDGELLFNNGENVRRWEVLVPALEIELKDVADGTTFAVEDTRAYDGASLVWNWGDGSAEKWISSSPKNHTYSNSGKGDYTIRVKGLLRSISSPSAETGAYVHPESGNENPYLVGFRLPENTPLQSVGNHAFSRCPKLRNVNTLNLPRARGAPRTPAKRDSSKTRLENLSSATTRGIVTYGEGCFARSGIEDLSGLPDNTSYLPRSMFAYNSGLQSLSGLPSGILDVDGEAFRECTGLSGLEGWPAAVGYISDYCFANCHSITSLAGISSAPITSIGEGAFASCTNLSSLVGLPPTVEIVGPNSFQDTALSSLAGLPPSVTNIGDSAFAGCLALSSAAGIGNGVAVIPERAFLSCTNMATLGTIPENATRIMTHAFAKCSSVSNGAFGGVIKEIGEDAFIYIGEGAEPTADESGLVARAHIDVRKMLCSELIAALSARTNENAFVKFNCRDGYVMYVDGNWKAFYRNVTVTLKNVRANSYFSVGKIKSANGGAVEIDWGDGETAAYSEGASHFYRKAGDYTISFLGFIESIGGTDDGKPFVHNSDGKNPNLVSFTIGDTAGVKELGAFCFKDCPALPSLSGFGDSLVASLGTNCFANCTGLSSLVGLPPGLSSLGDGCFSGCSGLQSVDWIPDGIRSLPSRCFADCTGLTSLSNLNARVEELGFECFKGCSGLETLGGMGARKKLAIGNGCFSSCTGLRDLSGLDVSNMMFSVSCFADCTGLESLNGMPESASAIPALCFANCTNLSTLAGMSGRCAEIGEAAFSNCTGLASLEGCSPSVATIDECAFASCRLESLAGIPPALVRVYPRAFSGNTRLEDLSAWTVCTNGIELLDECFKGCTALGTGGAVQQFPPNLVHIGARAFAECPHMDAAAIPDSVSYMGEGAFAGCWMRSLSSFPTNCQFAASNLFERTSLADVEFSFVSPEAFMPGCFSGERGLQPFKMDTFDTTRIVRLPNIDSSDLKSADGFPFGASETTRFICRDGFIVSAEGAFRGFSDSMAFTVVVGTFDAEVVTNKTPEETIVDEYTVVGAWVSRLKPKDGGFLSVDFGDGFTTNVFAETDRPTHVYSATGTYTIVVRGEIDVAGSNGRCAGMLANRFRTINRQYFPATSTSVEYNWTSDRNHISQVFLSEASGIRELGNYAFRDMAYIETPFTIPSTVEKIGNMAFSGCSGMSGTVVIPSNVVSIGVAAFTNCAKITGVVIESPVLSAIPDRLFYGCSSLNTLAFASPTAVTTIGNNILTGTSFASGTLDLTPCTKLVSISSNAFAGADGPSAIRFGNDISSLRANLSGVRKNFTVELPTYTTDEAFGILDRGWSELVGFEVVTHKMWGANPDPYFYKLTSFSCSDGEIYFVPRSTQPPYNLAAWYKRYGTDVLFIDRVEAGEEYVVSSVSSDGDFQIDWGDGTDAQTFSRSAENVSHVYESGHDGIAVRFKCLNGSKITAVSGDADGNPLLYAAADKGTFSHGGITRVTLGNGIKTIGPNAFRGYSGMSLSPFSSDSAYTSVGDRAFAGCLNLQYLNFPSKANNLSFGSRVFEGCTKLQYESCEIGMGSLFPSFRPDTFDGVAKRIRLNTGLSVGEITNRLGSVAFQGGVSFAGSDGEVWYEDGARNLYLPTIELIGAGSSFKIHAGRFGRTGNVFIGYRFVPLMRHDGGQAWAHLVTWTGNPFYPYGVLPNGTYGQFPDPSSVQQNWTAPAGLKKIIVNKDASLEIGDWCFAFMDVAHVEFENRGRVYFRGKGIFAGSDVTAEKSREFGVSRDVAEYQYFGCTNLTSLEVADGGVVKFEKNAFKNSGVKSLAGWREGMTEVPESAFENAPLESLAGMPASVTAIGSRAFWGTKLETLDGISPNLVSIGDNAFRLNSRLKSVKALPPTLASIGNFAFVGMDETVLLEMPNTNVAFHANSFQYTTDNQMSAEPLYFKFPGASVYSFKPNCTDFWTIYDTGYGGRAWYGSGMNRYYPFPNQIFVCYCDDGILLHQTQFKDTWSTPVIKMRVTDGFEPFTVKLGALETFGPHRELKVDWGDGAVDFYDAAYMLAVSAGEKELKPHVYQKRLTYGWPVTITGYVKNIRGHGQGLLSAGEAGFVEVNSDTCLDMNGASNLGRNDNGDTSISDISFSRPANPSAPDKAELPGKPADYTDEELKDLDGYPFGISGSVKGVDESNADMVLYMTSVPNGKTFLFQTANSAVVDWGDGTVDTATGSSVLSHTYSRNGDYKVSVDTRGGYEAHGFKSSGSYTGPVLGPANGSQVRENQYLRNVHLRGIKKIGPYCFYNCNNLEYFLSISPDLTLIGRNAFAGTSLRTTAGKIGSSGSLTVESGAFAVNASSLKVEFNTPFRNMVLDGNAFPMQDPYAGTRLEVKFNGKWNEITAAAGFPFFNTKYRNTGLESPGNWRQLSGSNPFLNGWQVYYAPDAYGNAYTPYIAPPAR